MLQPKHTLQGVCYKPPELTAADKAEPWDQDDTMAGVSKLYVPCRVPYVP